jgi:hypothetical protein
MRRVALACIALAAVALLLLVNTEKSKAADHGDSPSVGQCDIADLYSWMTPDANRLVLAATFGSGFSNGCQYVLHTKSMDAFGAADGTSTMIICHYDNNAMSCWVGEPNNPGGGTFQSYVSGDINATTQSDDGMVSLFAGDRDDPFFFNGEGFNATVETVRGAAAGLVPDEYGCPAVDAGTSAALVAQLGNNAAGDPGTDSFAGLNTYALVLELDKTLVNGGGDIISVWASTRQR